MNIILDQEIDFKSKLVLWTGMPGAVSREILCAMFQRDILILDSPADFNKIAQCGVQVAALMVNLDELFSKSEFEETEFIEFTMQIVEKISSINNIIKVFHALNFPADLAARLSDKGVQCRVTGQLLANDTIEQEVLNLLKPLYVTNSSRTSLRLTFKNEGYPVELKVNSSPHSGFLKDLSSAGAGLVMKESSDLVNLRIGDFVQITIDFHVTYLDISRCIVIRKDLQHGLVGVKFDIDDPFMIDPDNRSILTSIISTWINKLISSGTITLDSFCSDT
jgi:hypothetical protein